MLRHLPIMPDTWERFAALSTATLPYYFTRLVACGGDLAAARLRQFQYLCGAKPVRSALALRRYGRVRPGCSLWKFGEGARAPVAEVEDAEVGEAWERTAFLLSLPEVPLRPSEPGSTPAHPFHGVMPRFEADLSDAPLAIFLEIESHWQALVSDLSDTNFTSERLRIWRSLSQMLYEPRHRSERPTGERLHRGGGEWTRRGRAVGDERGWRACPEERDYAALFWTHGLFAQLPHDFPALYGSEAQGSPLRGGTITVGPPATVDAQERAFRLVRVLTGGDVWREADVLATPFRSCLREIQERVREARKR